MPKPGSAVPPPHINPFDGNGYIQLQRCERDPHRLLGQGLATIVRIAQGESSKIALEAGQWLVQYGEGLMRERMAAKLAAGQAQPGLGPPSDRQAILDELKGLYAKALGPSTLIVEAEPEPEPNR